MADPRQDLYALTRPALHALIGSWGISPVHGKAVWKALYLGRADALGQIPGIPLRLRERLEAQARIGSLSVAGQADSSDGFTRKFLLSLSDGERIEAVLMRFTGRVTACVSSQAGCAMGCVFCATGQMGYRRQLTTAEIMAQVMHVARALSGSDRPGRLRNIVFMGMGEPLLNYEAVMEAVGLLMDPHGLGIGGAHITVSTVGVVPGIRRMADEACPACLAVSLHAPTQEERLQLVPVARKWPLGELMDACRYYCDKLGRRIFFELALIDGRNDSEEHAHAIGRLLKGMQAQVNLIPLNPTAGYSGAPSRSEAAKAFQAVLAQAYGLPSTVRQRRGIDIAAGCGQLAAAGRGPQS
ncbi:MAG TPA: 23S rRNA (adenine(2503)-C(2))-methyltransferase RlmN [Opitutaceae bacterium]|jgi:23S rRNA (adenine2503-C2)-methyltransferase